MKCGTGNQCLAHDALDCGGGHSCSTGMKCGSKYQCLARDDVDCGGGRSCPAGNVCLNGGSECMTPAALAERAEAQKEAARAKADLEARVNRLKVEQRKEEVEDAAWLKREEARLAKETEKRKAADVETARQNLANQKPRQQATQQQLLKDAEQSTTITTIRSGTNSTETPQSTQANTNEATKPADSTVANSSGKPGSIASAQSATAVQIGKPVSIGTPVNVATPTNIGTPVNIGKPVNTGTPTNVATAINIAKPVTSGTPANIGSAGVSVGSQATKQSSSSSSGSIGNSTLAANQTNALLSSVSSPLQQSDLWSKVATSSSATPFSPAASSTFAANLQPVQGVTRDFQSSAPVNQVLMAVATGANNTATSLTKFYETPAGQTIAETAAEAGSVVAPKPLSGLGGVETGTNAVVLYRQGNYLGLAQVGVNYLTTKEAEYTGAYIGTQVGTLAGVGPVVGAQVGKAIGGSVATFGLDVGDLYVAPALGNIIYNADPGVFAPASK